jgi:hypothetical protein
MILNLVIGAIHVAKDDIVFVDLCFNSRNVALSMVLDDDGRYVIVAVPAHSP